MATPPIMLDVDTGVDDALAIAYALGVQADVVGISTVAGNVGVAIATDNTLRVLDYLGAPEVPVFRGASRPLVASFADARNIHGANGLGGVRLPESVSRAADLTAPEAIIAMAEEFTGELVLVAVGPYTNIVMALSLRPDLPEMIARLVVMGGAYFVPGNMSPYAEFNIYTDPDAAAQVFATDWQDMIAIGLDVTHQTGLAREVWERLPTEIEGAPWLLQRIVERTFLERVRPEFHLHDPLAMAVALDDSLVDTDRYQVDVVTVGDERGRTVVSGGGNVRIARSVDSRRFMHEFGEALGIHDLG